RQELAVCDALVPALDRDLPAATLRNVAIDEMRGRIEALGNAERRGICRRPRHHEPEVIAGVSSDAISSGNRRAANDTASTHATVEAMKRAHERDVRWVGSRGSSVEGP